MNTFTRHNLVTLSLEIPNARPFLLTTCSCWELSEIQQTKKHRSRIHAVLLGNSSCYVWSLAVKILHTCRFFPHPRTKDGLAFVYAIRLIHNWYRKQHSPHTACRNVYVELDMPNFDREGSLIPTALISYWGQLHLLLGLQLWGETKTRYPAVAG